MAIDWTAPMRRWARYHRVDPSTWGDMGPIDGIEGCTIVRDESLPTMGNATFQMQWLPDEVWIRAYMMAEQDGESARVALGTFCVPPGERAWDGMRTSTSVAGYTALHELAGDGPPHLCHVAESGLSR